MPTFLSTYNTHQQHTVKLLAGAFKSGVTADLVNAGGTYLAGGGTAADLADLLLGYYSTQTGFSGYASTATDTEFVTALVANLVAGTSIAQATQDTWVAALTPLVSTFATRGAFAAALNDLVDAVNSTNTTDADLLALAAVTDNRAEVAAAYAGSTAGATFASVTALGTAITGVTNDAATVASSISTNFGSTMPAPTTFTVTSSASSITEGGAATTITVTANTTTYAPISFTYNVSGDTLGGVASAGSASDVQTATGTVTIAAGASTGTFTVTASSDTTTEGLEGLKVALLGAGNTSVGYVLVSVQDAPGGTFTLTTAADNINGTVGDDVITGTLPYTSTGALDSSATLTAGDIISGGSGTDTLQITVSGANTASAGTVSPNLTGVEKVLVSNVASDDDPIQTISLALSNGVTTVGTNSSTTAGVATIFTDGASLVDMEMAGKGNLSVGYSSSTISAGTADAANVTLKSVGTSSSTRSTLNLTTGGVETLNVTSSTGSNYVTVTDSGLKTLNISGDKSAYIATPTSVTTVDMSKATASQTVDVGAVGTVSALTVTGGAGTADTLVLGTVVTAASDLKNVSGVEVVKMTAVNVTLAADIAGVSTFDLSGTGVEIATFNTGYTAATTVKVGATGADSVVNNSAANITVSGSAANFDGRTITGSTSTSATDAISMTADDTSSGLTSRSLTSVSNVETITVTANTSDASKGVYLTTDSGTVASGKSMTIDASALGSTAVFKLNGSATPGNLNVTGGAGNDSITGGTGNNTLSGGAGIDTITGGTGNDSIGGGDGNDSIVMAGNLTSTDTIDGGSGTDTLSMTTIGSSGAFANVTNVENIAITGASTISLTSAIGASASFDLSATTQQQLTFASGYTGDTTVKLTGTGGASSDKVVNSANAALTVNANLSDFTGGVTTLTGGTGTDTLNITATSGTGDLSGLGAGSTTEFDVINILANTTTASQGATFTGLVSDDAAHTVKVDASALTNSSAAFSISGMTNTAKMSIIGGAGGDTITLANGAGSNTVDGGAGNDTITGGAGADSLSGGAGNDTFTMAGNITVLDSIDGGDGTDTVTVSALPGAALNNVKNVEVLAVTGATTVAMDTTTNSFSTVSLSEAGNQVLNLNAGYTQSATVKITGDVTTNQDSIFNGDTGADGKVASGSANFANTTLVVEGNVGDFDAGFSIEGGTGSDTLKMYADSDGTGAILTDVSGVETITILANTTDSTRSAKVTLNGTKNIADGATLTVDASALTGTSAALVYSGSAITGSQTGKQVVTGGANADNITTGVGADSIVGGGGADFINSGFGLDTITGGDGADLVQVHSNSNLLAFSTVTDFAAGDALYFGTGAGTATTSLTKITLSSAATLSDYIHAGAGVSSGANSTMSWFNFGTNTYVVQDNSAANAFVAGATTNGSNDRVIELQGTLDLTNTTKAVVTVDSGTIQRLTFATAASTTSATAAGFAVTGTTAAETFTGTASADTITGGGGADTITGAAAADTITAAGFASGAALSIDGGADGDTVTITAANTADWATADTVKGGTETDTLKLLSSTGLTITEATNMTEFETYQFGDSGTSGSLTQAYSMTTKVADLDGSGGATTVTFNASALTTGTLTLNLTTGTALTDKASVTGGGGADVVTGGDAADTISGGAGGDSLVGGVGADSITGGEAADTITGGAGDDAIVLTETAAASDKVIFSGATTAANGADTITGFKAGETTGDILTFSSLTAGALANAVVGTAITLATTGALATEGTPIAVASNKVYVAQVANVAAIDTAAEVITALTDTGVLDAVDVAASATAFLVLSGADNTTTAYVYGVTNDGTAAVAAGELVLLGTITTDSTTFTTGNFAYA